MKHKSNLLVILIMVSVFALVIGTAPAFDECVDNNANKESQQTTKKHPFVVRGDCFLVAFRDSDSIITALATLVMAWLTLNIARANDTMARANQDLAKLSANQVENDKAHERAYVFAYPRYDHETDFYPSKEMPEGRRVSLRVKNFGRTPAIVRSAQWYVVREADLPNEPRYGADTPLYAIIEAGDMQRTKAGELIYKNTWGDETYVVYGRISYEDMFHKTHTNGFIWRAKWMHDTEFEHFAVEGFEKYIWHD